MSTTMPSGSDPLNVLVIIQGQLGEHLAGPEIRGWEIAQAIATRHHVTVAANGAQAGTRDGIAIVPRTRRSLIRQARRNDVVIGPLLPPYLLLAMAVGRKVRVADLYDPVDLELSTLGTHWRARRLLAERRAMHRLQLRSADVVVYANAPQRSQAVEEIAQAGRHDAGPRIAVAAMGLPEAPLSGDDHPLRERFDAIGPSDPVVLWWGSVWRWLDATTAIRAVELLAERMPDVRLIITAGPPPNEATITLNATAQARELAAERGLLGRHVFFLEEWVPYAERHRYLRDADVGITLHDGGAEAPLAARARYLDYIWAGLPSVLARGDVMADQMAQTGAARLVSPGDPVQTAGVLEAMLRDPQALRDAREACGRLTEELRWPAVLEPMIRTIEETEPRGRSPLRAFGVGLDTAGFYARRMVNACLGVS